MAQTGQIGKSTALDSIAGEYTGLLFGSELKIVLQELTNGNATGFDEHKGIQRPLKGDYTFESNTIKLILSEPGDHKYDGIHTIQINTNCSCGTGNWKSYKGKKEFPIERIQKQESSQQH